MRTRIARSLPPLILILALLGGCLHLTRGPGPAEMVWIPGGSFIMGASPEDGLIGIEVGVDQVPRHAVYVKGFYIDRFETRVSEYREFVLKTGYHPPSVWSSELGPKIEETDSVSDLSSVDAEMYCLWKGKRLPTESEWEKAARGTDGRKWPWGNDFSNGVANTLESGLKRIVAPGTFSKDRSPYGIYDMGGNVMEWTSSWYDAYPGNPLRRESFGQRFKILRGGTWSESALPFARTTHRFAVIPTLAQPDFGVRCAKGDSPGNP